MLYKYPIVTRVTIAYVNGFYYQCLAFVSSEIKAVQPK